MSVHLTACPRNCYCTCALRVHVEGGRIVRIEPDPANRATGEGVCLKGQSYAERVVSPDRILTPLRKRSDGAGFEAIGWDAAIEEIASRLARYREESGSHSVLHCAGSGTKGLLNEVGASFFRMYGGCTTTYGDLCWPAGLEATRLTLGKNEHNAPWDLVHARGIVLWGKNPAETNVHQVAFLEEAQKQGARLVVIDPRRTPSAERADLLLQPRPGTDAALALAVAHVLFERKLVDRTFLEEHVLGFEEYAERVRDWTPPRAAKICGVSPAAIEELAELIGTVKPLTIVPGYGMQRWSNGGQTMRTILALVVLTGNLGRTGAGWSYANLQTHIFGERDPIASYPPATDEGPFRVSISVARLGRDILETRDPALRMIWVERGNPLAQNPDTNTVREAFRSLDFRVVVDQFLTDTALEADLVLPAKSFLEQSDVIGAYWHPYLQLKRKVLEPPGEVKPESEIYASLARRMGFDAEAIAACFPEGDAAVDAWLEDKLAPFADVDLAPLEEGPVLSPAFEEIPFADLVFPTPSGKIELRSEEAARRWEVDPLPAYVEPIEPPRFPLFLLTPNRKDRIHSQFTNLTMIADVEGEEHASLHPDDAAERGIRDGDSIRLFNDRGEVRTRARLDHGLRRGCVAMPNGGWGSRGAGVNNLSLGRETDMGHGAAFHDNRVGIEKVER